MLMCLHCFSFWQKNLQTVNQLIRPCGSIDWLLSSGEFTCFLRQTLFIWSNTEAVSFPQTHKPHRGERTDSPVSEGHSGGKTPDSPVAHKVLLTRVTCRSRVVCVSCDLWPTDLACAVGHSEHSSGRQQDCGAMLSLSQVCCEMCWERLRLPAAATRHSGETHLVNHSSGRPLTDWLVIDQVIKIN